MKNKIFFFSILLLLYSCKKDDPRVVHSGTTRIDYSVNNPMEMPAIDFMLNSITDLSGHSLCSITLIANESSEALNLMIMIEDEDGNRTDVAPFTIQNEDIEKDNVAHTFSYDFTGKLSSSTTFPEVVNIQRIRKVKLLINAGVQGSVSAGTFWLDKIEFTSTD